MMNGIQPDPTQPIALAAISCAASLYPWCLVSCDDGELNRDDDDDCCVEEADLAGSRNNLLAANVGCENHGFAKTWAGDADCENPGLAAAWAGCFSFPAFEDSPAPFEPIYG